MLGECAVHHLKRSGKLLSHSSSSGVFSLPRTLFLCGKRPNWSTTSWNGRKKARLKNCQPELSTPAQVIVPVVSQWLAPGSQIVRLTSGEKVQSESRLGREGLSGQRFPSCISFSHPLQKWFIFKGRSWCMYTVPHNHRHAYLMQTSKPIISLSTAFVFSAYGVLL